MSTKGKLFPHLLDDAEWVTWPAATRLVWFTLMGMADKKGEIDAHISAIARRARVSLEEAKQAILTMQQPNPMSRYPVQGGKTLEPTARGWRLLQFDHYWK